MESGVRHLNQTLGEDISNNTAQQVNHKLLRAVTITVITLAIYVLNTLSIVLLWKTWTSRKWQDNVVMLGLFATDLLNGMTSFTMSSLASWHPSLPHRPYFTEVHFFFFFLCSVASLYTLAGASIVQALCVVRPLRFPSEVTPQRMLLGMLLLWALAIAAVVYGLSTTGDVSTLTTTYLPVVNNAAFGITIVIGGILAATLIISYCYGRIFLAVLGHKRFMASTHVTIGNARSNHANQGSVLEAIRSAKKIFVVTVVYYVAYFPSLIMTLTQQSIESEFSYGLVCFYLLWLQVSNSFFNSLVYIIMNSRMRQALVNMFCCKPGASQ